MTIKLTTWQYCKLLEGGWFGSHLCHDILEAAISLWRFELTPEERAEVLAHFAAKERAPEGTAKRVLQEHLLCSYDALLQVRVKMDGEEVMAYRFGNELHVAPDVRIVQERAEPVPAKPGPRPPVVEHRASFPILGLQGCVECGEVLIDHRNSMTTGPAQKPVYWPEGPIFQDGNFWMSEKPKRVKVVKCTEGK